MSEQFKECDSCAAKPGTPILCAECLARREIWQRERQPEPTHYILVEPTAVFVKEAAFFRQQGGLTQIWGQRWRPVVADSIEAARALGDPRHARRAQQMAGQRCDGFWNHCACPDCMKKDRALEADLEKASPDERRKMVEAASKAIMTVRGIKP